MDPLHSSEKQTEVGQQHDAGDQPMNLTGECFTGGVTGDMHELTFESVCSRTLAHATYRVVVAMLSLARKRSSPTSDRRCTATWRAIVVLQEPKNVHISQKFLPFTLPGTITYVGLLSLAPFRAGTVTVLLGRHQADFWQIAENLYD
jgi:hypothetical protein